MGAVMAYGMAVAALVAAGAWMLERALRAVRAPVRGVWVVAVAASLSGVGWALVPTTVSPSTPAAIEAADAVQAPASVVLPRVPAPPAPPIRLDPALAAGWGVLSLLVAVGLARSVGRLNAERRRWGDAVLDGRPVRVSDGLGPAAVGLVDPVIVVPRWVLDLPLEDRALLIRHESEHLRAGDGWLLLGGLVALVLVPWNPVVWWQVSRLRAAIELDCDRRVLRRSGDLHRYARLLVDTGRRRWTAHLGVAAFARPVSLLERRIRTMTDRRTPRRWKAALTAALGVVVAVAACRVDRPTAPDLADPVVSAQAEGADAGPFVIDVRADPGVIVGIVTDPETGEPVEAAQVVIPALEQGALTNIQGRFLMINVPVGTHRVVVEKPGVEGTSEVLVEVAEAGPPQVSRPFDPDEKERARSEAELQSVLDGLETVRSDPARRSLPAADVPASELGRVAGVIRGADGRPLGSAQVSIPELERGALTNPSGRFLLMHLTPGTYRMHVRTADGVDLDPVEITVVQGETREASVTAGGRDPSPDAVADDDGVDVVGP